MRSPVSVRRGGHSSTSSASSPPLRCTSSNRGSSGRTRRSTTCRRKTLRSSGHRRPASRLPNYATSFIGRENECAALVAALADHQLVTIVGPGGVGKTRLAVEVARQLLPRYPDGIAYVELAPLGDSDAVAHRVASVLRVTPHDAAELLDAIVAAVEHRRCLVVLDNCEHVRSAAHDFVARLLAASETVSVLATSRERLGLASEHVWPAPSLDPATAGPVLFTDRGARRRPSFELGDDHEPSSRCAAASTDCHSPSSSSPPGRPRSPPANCSKERSMAGCSGEPRPQVHDRHRTLRSAIDWSVQLLGDADRRLLARLSTFAGPATLVDLRAVCAGAGLSESDVTESVERLVDKSLLVAGRVGGEFRYSLLETVRAHARECLADAGEVRALAIRHASHVQDRLARIRAGLRGRERARRGDRARPTVAGLPRCDRSRCVDRRRGARRRDHRRRRPRRPPPGALRSRRLDRPRHRSSRLRRRWTRARRSLPSARRSMR